MPHIRTQSDFQRLSKPNFCYLCGADLNKDAIVNSDHCPPEKLFHPSDRIDYPIKVKVHASCNHKWHEDDEKLSIFFDILHGGKKVNDPELLKKLSFLSVVTAQGVYKGVTCFPLLPLARRIIRCAHALLYGGHLPRATSNHIHYPIPEIDPDKGNEPFPNLMQTYSFANELCSAQKAETFDSLIAYNGKFKYVCTWSYLDNGDPICIFAFDIYRLANFAIKIEDFPRAVIGFYSVLQIPSAATQCTKLQIENSNEEVLHPILPN